MTAHWDAAAVLHRLQGKVDRMIGQLQGKTPHAARGGIYDDTRLDWWTSGFWPGILWVMYDVTGREHYREAAWDWDVRMEQCMIAEANFHHDVGFQFLPTAVIKHTLTGDRDGRRRGLAAANFLAGRFNLEGRFLRAWNPTANPNAWNAANTGWAIIDSMMNLSLLFWASEELGDPRFKQIAMAHADTVLRHFIRGDGSVIHIGSFDPATGEFIEAIGGQGCGPQSAWSRGNAWALHGLANTYRCTGEARYLDTARQVAHYFIAALEPDAVPLWDFRVDEPDPAGEPRDTSAASCAASGLLEIADAVRPAEARLYREAAVRMLASLTDNYAEWDREEHQPILREGTGHKPAGQNINVGLIYGDYFYVEAIAKLNGWKHRIF